jgi:hypothetical protein
MEKTDRLTKRNLETELKTRRFPRCFESQKQYEVWLEGEAIANTLPVRRNICEDCETCYKNRMILEGRCANIQIVLKS